MTFLSVLIYSFKWNSYFEKVPWERIEFWHAIVLAILTGILAIVTLYNAIMDFFDDKGTFYNFDNHKRPKYTRLVYRVSDIWIVYNMIALKNCERETYAWDGFDVLVFCYELPLFRKGFERMPRIGWESLPSGWRRAPSSKHQSKTLHSNCIFCKVRFNV